MRGVPILYSFRRCPYAIRARLALLASETQCVLREVSLSAKPVEMLAASPKATVPVLVLPDGGVIDQSVDIMRWSLARHDPAGWLDHQDATLIDANDGAFKHHLDGAKYPDRHGSDPDQHRAACLAMLRPLEERLTATRYLCGDVMGLTDAAILPFVRQFASIDRGWFDAQPVPHVRRWLDEHVASDLFDAAMIRLASWRPGDPDVHFPAARPAILAAVPHLQRAHYDRPGTDMNRRLSKKDPYGDLHREEEAPPAATICWLCGRPTGKTIVWHHPVPKSRGGRDVVPMHSICQQTLMANFTNSELQRHGLDVEALLSHPAVRKFVYWVANKDPDFTATTAKNQR